MPWPAESSAHRSIELAIPSAGWWAVDVLQAGKAVSSVPLLARQDGCLGGARKIAIETHTGAHLHGVPMMIGEEETTAISLELRHHAIATGDGAAIVEWRHAGEVVVTESVQLDRKLSDDDLKALERAATLADLDAVCPLMFAWDTLNIPTKVGETPGAWEARIYERDAQAYAVRFRWKRGSLHDAIIAIAPIATPPKLAYDTPADPVQVARALRAMLRSRDAATAWLARKQDPATLASLVAAKGGVFTDAEMPVPVAAHLPKAIATRLPPRIDTPDLPAISPDGKTFAIRDHVELQLYEDECHPDTGDQLELYAVANPKLQVPSQDLSKFEPLVCNGKLPVGLVVAHPEVDHLQIRDAKGAVIFDTQTGHGEDVCVSAKQRVIVVMLGLPLGGDCRTASGMAPQTVRY
jgi:hypothetical protein